MNDDDLAAEEVALTRLTGGLLIASGLLIAALCGGCTMNVLMSPNGVGVAPLALVFGGAPAAGGLFLVVAGLKQLSRTRLTAASTSTALATAMGWALAGVGVLIALAATYQVVLDGWVLLNAMQNKLNGIGGGGFAFFAALEHAILFILAAGAVELGRRMMHGGRS
jgi:hypothetical protein